MKNFVIEVENLSKKYNIVHLERGFITLRDKLEGAIKHPIALLRSLKNSKQEDFWALRDINFSVEVGEMVGIIGGNGAGKSTLLKVLSRITPPSTGKVKISGRVASMLEVGTGFHPELTGRENIFLNGAILGMPRTEIIKKFDEIVEFAGVAKFLDTPVKRYSSGMYVRLAFAVAAHMDSDILFVDEVLAVGDAEFQKKCLGKMSEMVKDKQKTILFVSHNLAVIKALCPRSILLDNGKMIAEGPTSEVVDKYLDNKAKNSGQQIKLVTDSNQPIKIKALNLINPAGQIANLFKCDQAIAVDFVCQLDEVMTDYHGHMAVSDSSGNVIMESYSDDSAMDPFTSIEAGDHNFRLIIPARSLAPGRYSLSISFFKNSHSDIGILEPMIEFELIDEATIRGGDRNGWFSTILKWEKN